MWWLGPRFVARWRTGVGRSRRWWLWWVLVIAVFIVIGLVVTVSL
jgi:hypothetical protein